MKHLTHEEVNELEERIRNAQAELEAAGRIICSVREAGELWNQVTVMALKVGDLMQNTYLLRPED